MVTERIYYPEDLTEGICSCCGEESDSVAKFDGRCVDCIEDERFMDECEKMFAEKELKH